MLSIPIGDLSRCDAAAVCALGAVDGIFDVLSDGFEPPLDEVVAFHPGAEALVLLALFLAEPLDLDEVGGDLFGQSACKNYYRG